MMYDFIIKYIEVMEFKILLRVRIFRMVRFPEGADKEMFGTGLGVRVCEKGGWSVEKFIGMILLQKHRLKSMGRPGRS